MTWIRRHALTDEATAEHAEAHDHSDHSEKA